MNTPVPFVKGQTLTSMLLFAQRQLTQDQYQQLLAILSDAERREVAHILPTSTYPVALVNRLTIEAARIAKKPLPEFAREAGRFNAAQGIRGVYRFFARIMTPDALLAKAATMWSTMNLAGTMSMKKEGRNAGVLWLTGYPEPTDVMCLRISGWMEQLLELAGSKKPIVSHTQCVAHGAKACEWHVEW